MNKLWKIIKDDGELEIVDLEQNTIDEWVNGRGWASYHQTEGAPPLTYRCASTTYFENFFQNECKDEVGSDYERKDCRIKEGDVVVDVGGNIGCFSRYALTRGASRILSFEPFSKNFDCLRYNTENTLIESFNLGISDKAEVNTLLASNEFSGGSNMVGNEDNGLYNIQEEIECITLDSLFEDGVIDKIDFLKVDCEGSEMKVMDGLSDENLDKVDRIAMEFHHSLVPEGSKDRLLERLGSRYNLFFFNCGNLSIYHFWKK